MSAVETVTLADVASSHVIDLCPPGRISEPPDPRPDLVEDSEEWRVLLDCAWERSGLEPRRDGTVYVGLLCTRACGGRLVWTRSGGLVLRPGSVIDGAAWSDLDQAGYDQVRRDYLTPLSSEVRDALSEAAHIMDGAELPSLEDLAAERLTLTAGADPRRTHAPAGLRVS